MDIVSDNEEALRRRLRAIRHRWDGMVDRFELRPERFREISPRVYGPGTEFTIDGAVVTCGLPENPHFWPEPIEMIVFHASPEWQGIRLVIELYVNPPIDEHNAIYHSHQVIDPLTLKYCNVDIASLQAEKDLAAIAHQLGRDFSSSKKSFIMRYVNAVKEAIREPETTASRSESPTVG